MAEKEKKHIKEAAQGVGREGSAERESDSMRHFDREYTARYRKWRQDNKDSYGFFYRGKGNEYTYLDGYGFVRDIPESMETQALGYVNSIVGYVLLFCAVLNIFFYYIMPLILNGRLELPIGTIRPSGGFYGNESFSVVYSYVVQTFVRIVPIVTVLFISKMPLKVMLPTKISNRPLFNIAIPAAMLTAAVSMCICLPYYALLNALGVNTNRSVYVPESPVNLVLMIFLNVIILPVLNEVITRGALMQLLRQFGDGYALMTTGLVTALMSGDIRTFPVSFFYSIVIGYFVLRTGSIITAFIMRVTVAAFFWVFPYFTAHIENKIISLNFAFILLCITVGLFFVIRFVMNYSNKTELPIKQTFLTSYEKFMRFFTCPPLIIWLSLEIALMMLAVPLVF